MQLNRKLSNRRSLTDTSLKNIFPSEEDLQEKTQRRVSAEKVMAEQIQKMKENQAKN